MARRNVHCVKPSDPPFLRKMKERCGYNQITIETKKQELLPDSDAYKDREDELPQVVVLKAGDLTCDQVDEILKNQDKIAQNNSKADGNTSRTEPELMFRTKFKRCDAASSSGENNSKKQKNLHTSQKKSNVKAVKDNRLLSFGDDDDDEN